MEKKLSVSAIKDGTVIDHVSSGSALTIIKLLKLLRDKKRVTVGLNLSSDSMGYKDIIKIENRVLTEKEAHDIAVFAPEATINIIRNYHVEKKIKASMPSRIEKILICPNTRCISRKEPVDSLFTVEEYKNKVHLRCKYCEKVFERDEIKEYKT